MRAITSILVLAVFATASCNMRPLGLKSLQTVPITISDLANSQDALLNYQGTWTAQPQAGKTCDGNIQAISTQNIHVDEVEVSTVFDGATVNTTTVHVGQDVAAGAQLAFHYGQYIPRFSPAGAYILELSFKNSSGSEVGKAKVNFNLAPA